MRIRFVDLFCGAGGIRLGVEAAFKEYGVSTKCVGSSEIDPKACETYMLNFGESPLGDIREIHDLEPFDLLLAGFPCQAFSYAGKKLGFGDTRGTLFFEVERLLKKYKPRLVFLENVRGLITHDQGRTFATILERLEQLDYRVEHRVLNSSNYGIPQNRVRIYIIACLKKRPVITILSHLGAKDSHDFASYSCALTLFDNPLFRTVKDILDPYPDPKYDCSEWFTERLRNITNGRLEKLHGVRLIDTRHGNSIHSWDIGIKGACTEQEILFMNMLISNRRKQVFGTHQDGKALTIEQISTFYKKNDIGDILNSLSAKGYLNKKDERYNPVCGNMSFEVFKFLDPDSIAITLTASDAHKLGIYHHDRLRRLTPRECARLQGYPDEYKLHHQDLCAYKQLGNAVSVPVIKRIFVDFLANNQSWLE